VLAQVVRSDNSTTGGQLPKSQDTANFVVRGTVVDPDGKPFAGAKLRVEYFRADDSASRLSPLFGTESGIDGRFQLSIPKSEFDTSSSDEPWNTARILVLAEGLGFDAVRVKPGETDNIRLQLVKDVPINGRILSLEGTPVAGARIRIRGVQWTPGENLDSYIDALREGRQNVRFERYTGSPYTANETIQTDSRGRFQLRGMGAERLVQLYVEGPTIEHWWINVLTRDTKPVVQPLDMKSGRSRPDRTYGANFEHPASPGRPIVGTVRDRATGKPLVGVTVSGIMTISRTKTDEAGRFKLFGYPKSPEYYVQVAPEDGQPYLAASVKIADIAGLEPIETDVALSTGTLCRGQLTDKSTGRPVAGELQYYPLFPNVTASTFPQRDVGGVPWSTVTIKRDGKFVVPVLSGPGVLTFTATGGKDSDYAAAFLSTDEIEGFFGRKLGDGNYAEHLNISNGGQAASTIIQTNYHALALINPDEGAESIARDVALEPARRLRGMVRGPDGKPLTGTTAFGLTRHNFASTTLETAEFEAVGLNVRRPRVILFTHNENKLGFALTIRGNEPEPLVVQLKSLGAAVGRLLDKDGEPVRDTALNLFRERLIGPGGCSTKTDRDGRFRVEGLVCGQRYMLSSDGKALKTVDLSIEPGETKDLGDVKNYRGGE